MGNLEKGINMSVELESIELLKTDTNLRAFASVKVLNLFTINYIRVVQQPESRAFVQMPMYKRGNGYRPILTDVSPDLKDSICDVVLSAYDLRLQQLDIFE